MLIQSIPFQRFQTRKQWNPQGTLGVLSVLYNSCKSQWDFYYTAYQQLLHLNQKRCDGTQDLRSKVKIRLCTCNLQWWVGTCERKNAPAVLRCCLNASFRAEITDSNLNYQIHTNLGLVTHSPARLFKQNLGLKRALENKDSCTSTRVHACSQFLAML